MIILDSEAEKKTKQSVNLIYSRNYVIILTIIHTIMYRKSLFI